MDTKDKIALLEEAKKEGVAFSIAQWPQRLTYYKKDGEAMPNLPADPVSMKRYRNKGFTLVPPMPPKPQDTSQDLVGITEPKPKVSKKPKTKRIRKAKKPLKQKGG